VKILIDTHAFLWFIGGSPKLTNSALKLIEDTENKRLLSIVSLWEITIKASIGKLKIDLPLAKIVTEHIEGNAIELLEIKPEHLDTLKALPFYHKDPFDRLIIAKGFYENTPILSKDEIFDKYNIHRLWS